MLHVLAAIIGLGPAYAFPLLLNPTSSASELQRNLHLVGRLELFPKVFGTLAVVSGLILFWFGSYGTILQMWLLGTLIVYVIIEVLIIGFLNPAAKKLESLLASTAVSADSVLPSSPIPALYAKVRNLHLWASILSLVIFILMILKPH